MKSIGPQNRFKRLSGKGGQLSLMAAACVSTLVAKPASAFVSPDMFAQDETSREGSLSTFGQTQKPFQAKRVLRVERSKSHSQFTLDGNQQANIFLDDLDGSTVLRRGELGLSLDQVFLRDGRSVADALRSKPSSFSRQAIETLVARRVLATLQANPATNMRGLRLELDSERTFLGDQFLSVSFQLYKNNRRVEGTELTARFRDGEWVSWTSEAFGVLEDRAEVVPAALRLDLTRVAKEALGGTFSKVVSKESIYLPQTLDKRYKLEPATQAILHDKSGQTYTLTVSELDGSTLEFYAHRYNFEGKISGSYYERHPASSVVTTGMPYVQVKTGGIFDRKTFTSDRDGNLSVPGQNEVIVRLVSPFVNLSNSAGSEAQIPASGDVQFTPGENSSFAETTTYFHTNVVNDFVRERLDTDLDWLDKQLRATVNISSTCNAFYNGSINFFQAGSRTGRDGNEISCNNTGEISDVVYHEWGHGLDDNTGGIDDGAFSEGIGDILAMLITGSPEVGPHFITDGSPVRNLDGEYQYPPEPDMREVHKEGLIIGSTWYHLTEAMKEKYGEEIGRDTSARLFFKLLFTASRYEGAYDAAVDIDSVDGERGPNYCLINAAFSRHGLAELDDECKA